MNFSTFFLDKLTGTSQPVGLGIKNPNPTSYGFADIIKVCESETNSNVSPNSFSQVDLLTNDIDSISDNTLITSENNLIELSQIISQFISNPEQPVQLKEVTQNLDSMVVNKKIFVLSKDDLEKFLSELIENIPDQSKVTFNSGKTNVNSDIDFTTEKNVLIKTLVDSIKQNNTLNLSFKSGSQKIMINVSGSIGKINLEINPFNDTNTVESGGKEIGDLLSNEKITDAEASLSNLEAVPLYNTEVIHVTLQNVINNSGSIDVAQPNEIADSTAISNDTTKYANKEIAFGNSATNVNTKPEESIVDQNQKINVDQNKKINIDNNATSSLKSNNAIMPNSTVADGEKLAETNTKVSSQFQFIEEKNQTNDLNDNSKVQVNKIQNYVKKADTNSSGNPIDQVEASVVKDLATSLNTNTTATEIEGITNSNVESNTSSSSKIQIKSAAKNIVIETNAKIESDVKTSVQSGTNKILNELNTSNIEYTTTNELSEMSKVYGQIKSPLNVYSDQLKNSFSDKVQPAIPNPIPQTNSDANTSANNSFTLSIDFNGTENTVDVDSAIAAKPVSKTINTAQSTLFDFGKGKSIEAAKEISEFTKMFPQVKLNSNIKNVDADPSTNMKNPVNDANTIIKVSNQPKDFYAEAPISAKTSTVQTVQENTTLNNLEFQDVQLEVKNDAPEKVNSLKENDNIKNINNQKVSDQPNSNVKKETAVIESIEDSTPKTYEQKDTNNEKSDSVLKNLNKSIAAPVINDSKENGKKVSGVKTTSNADSTTISKTNDSESKSAVKETQSESSTEKDLTKQSNHDKFKENLVQRSNEIKDSGVEKIKNMLETKNSDDVPKTIKTSEIISELSKFIQQRGEKQSITFQLTPENLGKVKLVVDLIQNQITTHIEVENDQVRQFIQQNIEQLKSNLQSSGIQLNNVNISLANYEQQKSKQNASSRKYTARVTHVKEEKEEVKGRTKSMGYNTYEFLA